MAASRKEQKAKKDEAHARALELLSPEDHKKYVDLGKEAAKRKIRVTSLKANIRDFKLNLRKFENEKLSIENKDQLSFEPILCADYALFCLRVYAEHFDNGEIKPLSKSVVFEHKRQCVSRGGKVKKDRTFLMPVGRFAMSLRQNYLKKTSFAKEKVDFLSLAADSRLLAFLTTPPITVSAAALKSVITPKVKETSSSSKKKRNKSKQEVTPEKLMDTNGQYFDLVVHADGLTKKVLFFFCFSRFYVVAYMRVMFV